jgi:hypothetical protein
VRRASLLLAVTGAALLGAAPAAASGWLPHPAGASWTYEWSDTRFAKVPTFERVWVAKQTGKTFLLGWTSEDESLRNPDTAVAGTGAMRFEDTPSGLVNTDWAGTPPPAGFPVLCARANGCGNSLAGTYYNVIWGSSTPLLAEPLTIGASWTSRGGAHDDVRSTNRFVGIEQISVPAFKGSLLSAKIESQITSTGGDRYGSGTRTVWWVWGIGPVKVVFNHTGSRAVTSAVLTRTSLSPPVTPNLDAWFPLGKGTATYRWTNTQHFSRPVVERITSTGGGRFSASTVSGPIQAQASYRYELGLDGMTNVAATTRSASLVELPGLGPKTLPPAKRRRFATPFDLMNFGLNPLFPAYLRGGEVWRATPKSPDFATYGVTGTAKVLGLETITVPAGEFRCLVVQTTMKQAGFPFGSGTRTTWFAVNVGLVKLVFRHGDGSESVVERLK